MIWKTIKEGALGAWAGGAAVYFFGYGVTTWQWWAYMAPLYILLIVRDIERDKNKP